MDQRDFCIARPLRMATMRIMINSSLILCWFFCFGISYAADTLRPGEGITDGEFLESSGQVFRLQFFSPGASTNRYLGIKYMGYNAFTVWPANPENPLPDTSGVLNLTQDGNLVITDRLERSFTINSQRSNVNASAVLLDSGNLVLKAGDQIVWQSFDHPSDTLLPGMKLGRFDLKTGQPYNLSLTSWLSPEVLAPGAFTLGVDPNNTKQLVVWRRGVPYWRSGTWNGYNFSYFPDDTGLSIGFSRWNFSYLSNENESYFTLTVSNDTYGWIEMHSFGQIDQYVYNRSNVGTILASAHCNDNELDTRSKGCVIPESSGCSGGDVFPQKTGFMDGWEYLNDLSLGISDCREICVRNCSCNAYASARTDGTACKFSRAQNFISGGQEMMYVRNNTSVDKAPPRKKQLWLTVGAPVISLSVISLISVLCYLQRRGCFLGGKDARNRYGIRHDKHYKDIASLDELGGSPKLELSGKKGHELPLFNFSSIEIATDHFSNANKLGQGGFGPVYKGRLAEGKEIAVKRLSRSSRQGVEEFKNEVALISKLQHRNLVRLLGCCIEGEERILIYEYLPNNSLDSFLFDATKRGLLDWKRRVCIIEGIAQGLLYLHKYSRFRIIHRDLKTSNILLDHDMNPKISDFGTARIFEENEHQANTIRIVGTYGYMSPEYAMDGLFSEKSDVFSFGVMMLEIISGKKNTGFYESNRTLNLLGYAWDLYKDGRYLELIDPVIEETCSANEVMRCFQVGLLCVQESAVDRPTMALVVSMLSNESITLPTPKQPAFSNVVGVRNTTLPENQIPCSINDVTVTEIEAR